MQTTTEENLPTVWVREHLVRLAAAGGFSIEKRWTDRRGWFTDVLMRAE